MLLKKGKIMGCSGYPAVNVCFRDVMDSESDGYLKSDHVGFKIFVSVRLLIKFSEMPAAK